MSNYLSYLMGAEEILDGELEDLNIDIVGKTESGSRKLNIPSEHLLEYVEIIKNKLTKGFWNEIVGNEEIIFIFKFKDGTVKELKLSTENESEIDKLCAKFNNESPNQIINVYKWLSENDFYHDFMLQHYSNLINR